MLDHMLESENMNLLLTSQSKQSTFSSKLVSTETEQYSKANSSLVTGENRLSLRALNKMVKS